MNSIPDDEISLDWKRIEHRMQKEGWKNGLSDGRDSNLQESFNKGFADGFKHGFILSKINISKDTQDDLKCTLADAKKAVCIMCTNDEKDNQDITQIKEKQDKVIEAIVNNSVNE